MRIENGYVVSTIERPYKDRLASVRSFEFEEAKKRNLPLRIELKDTNEYMIVEPEELDSGNINPTEFESQYGGKYKLVDFPWITTTDEREAKKAKRIEMMGREWYRELYREFDKDYMKELNAFISQRRTQVPVYPETKNLFNAFRLTPFDKVKVVIVGQDPYHSVGGDGVTPIAHGLAFSSQDIKTCPPSLEVIFKEVEDDIKFGLYLNAENNLTYWAEQGVLLLNTILTSERGKALQHKGKGWEKFTDEVIKALNRRKGKLIFALWGKEAQQYRERRLIDTGYHVVLEAPHPAAEVYAAKEGRVAGFYGCRHFSKINQILKSWGREEIKW
jgi:uracil-DNA glycosylase